MHSLIIFASGKGSNTAAIIDYFKENGKAKVVLIVSNKANAGVLDIARDEHIPFLIVDKQAINETLLLDQLQSYSPSLIILAGFLWKVPDMLIQAFPQRIINIHPALLPDYGGKGMYGHYVHNAVLASGNKESGITIHYVNEVYDNGNVILQARCPVQETDTADDLAMRVYRLEYFFYPRTIEFLLRENSF
jgi:phosphoribosylglycinamide formyltransferase-1